MRIVRKRIDKQKIVTDLSGIDVQITVETSAEAKKDFGLENTIHRNT
jgi:hypothetical protein